MLPDACCHWSNERAAGQEAEWLHRMGLVPGVTPFRSLLSRSPAERTEACTQHAFLLHVHVCISADKTTLLAVQGPGPAAQCTTQQGTHALGYATFEEAVRDARRGIQRAA